RRMVVSIAGPAPGEGVYEYKRREQPQDMPGNQAQVEPIRGVLAFDLRVTSMSPYLKLAVFGLKQVVGGVVAETVESAVKFIEQHCADKSQPLPRALAKANDRAWKTLSIALAGDGWFDQLKNWFTPGDEKALADQVRLFLKSSRFPLDGSAAQFRRKCLAELNAALQAGLLSARHPSP